MKNLILILIVATFSSTFGYAHESSEKHEHKGHQHKGHDHKGHAHKMEDKKAEFKKITKEKVVIKVQGMVCAFCAQGIKKNFNAKKEVKETKVDLDKMEVTVVFNKGKNLSKEAMQKVVTDAGFKFVGVK